MKRRFSMVNLDCANCAAKMEAAIRKLDGVHDASVSFMTQRLTIDADDSRFETVMEQVETICHKVDPHCTVRR